MLNTIVIAIIIGVVVALVCLFVGRMIKTAGAAAPPLAQAGAFLEQFCWVVGLLVALAYFVGLIGPFKL